MIAIAARLQRFVETIEPWLKQWLLIESNEFARTAIVAALQSTASPDISGDPATLEMPVGFVETYRFVAERLCHRVRNTLSVPSAMMLRLDKLGRTAPDAQTRTEIAEILTRLRPAYQRLSQTLEFDTGDGYSEWRPFPLGDWLESSQSHFASHYGQAKLTVIGSPQVRRTTIRANHFLLETVFGNLWANAVQATDGLSQGESHITAEMNLHETDDNREKTLSVLLRDNGTGFTPEMVETAFQLQYSTKGESRGRGLLEIADAVRRLQGTVKLVPVAAKEFRILISFTWKSA